MSPYLFLGLGKLVDTSKCIVVIIDSLGNGISLSPSNAGRGSLAIPRFTDLSVWDRQGEDIQVNLGMGRRDR
jgi:homoserine acetyltransferase